MIILTKPDQGMLPIQFFCVKFFVKTKQIVCEDDTNKRYLSMFVF